MNSDFSMSDADRAVLRALAPIACSPRVRELGLIEDVVQGVEDFVGATPPLIGGALRLGIAVFEWSAALHPAHPGRRFTQLDPAQQEAWFARWWHAELAPLREFARRSKGLLAAVYYELDPVRAEIEYHPERWIAQVARRRIDRYGDQIRAREARAAAPGPLLAALAQHPEAP
jgi:hypothetical protein